MGVSALIDVFTVQSNLVLRKREQELERARVRESKRKREQEKERARERQSKRKNKRAGERERARASERKGQRQRERGKVHAHERAWERVCNIMGVSLRAHASMRGFDC